MAELFVLILLYYIIKWGLIIFAGIVALSLLIRLIRYIANVATANKKTKQAEKTYGSNSVGALLARNEADAARGDYEALLSTSVDRKDAKTIINWFNDVVTNRDYYAIYESEAAEGEPNYAFVMENNSGFDFKEFSCDISVKEGEKSLGTVVGTAKNWKNKTEEKLWFYCAGTVNKATIDVRSLKYVIDMDQEEDKNRRAQKRVEDHVSTVSCDNEFSKIYSNDIDFEKSTKRKNIYEPYICPECFEPYDGIYCENCGHSNDDPGYEEVSDDEKWVEGMVAAAMFDAEDRRREEFNNYLSYSDEFDENDIF